MNTQLNDLILRAGRDSGLDAPTMPRAERPRRSGGALRLVRGRRLAARVRHAA